MCVDADYETKHACAFPQVFFHGLGNGISAVSGGLDVSCHKMQQTHQNVCHFCETFFSKSNKSHSRYSCSNIVLTSCQFGAYSRRDAASKSWACKPGKDFPRPRSLVISSWKESAISGGENSKR
mmetsp:Transcript_2839/g.5376  ORF Transcript_2839/g.5376 Transcript_2839/m.5376 type:complete len:124 (+) Transcript_2839:71-442(+)